MHDAESTTIFYSPPCTKKRHFVLQRRDVSESDELTALLALGFLGLLRLFLRSFLSHKNGREKIKLTHYSTLDDTNVKSACDISRT